MKKQRSEDKHEEARQDLLQKLEKKELEQQKIMAINRQASAPVLADLARAGYEVELISDLFNMRINYINAIPILLYWLPRIEKIDVKESIVRALSVPWARPIAASTLISEFHKVENQSNTGIKWAIANALSVVADDSVFKDIEALVQDPRHGKAREMLALSLGNMRNPHAQDVLIDLLEDDEVAGHAIIVLSKLKSKKAYTAIERFLNHPKSWIGNEAKKALVRIEKADK